MLSVLGGIVFILAGGVLSGVGIYFFSSHKKTQELGHKTSALIIDSQKITDQDGAVYSSIVKFNDQEGKEIIQELNWRTNTDRKGDSIDITYYKRGETYTILERSTSVAIFPFIFIIKGAIFIIVGFLSLFGIIA